MAHREIDCKTAPKVHEPFPLSHVKVLPIARRRHTMKIVIQVSPRDSAKAWALLVRHSPGVALPDRTFVVSEEAARALREAGIRFSELSREAIMSGASAGERI
jgi:hypothetical protein